MERSENERIAALHDYEVVRRYELSTQRFDQYAEMLVRMNYTAPGTKTFDVLWEKGSGMIQKRAFRTILEAEADAAKDDMREQTRINRKNYDFRLLGTEVLDGRPAYVMEMTPKANRKYQMRGQIWIDMEDFAVARIEGTPVGKTSWWLRKLHMRQDYRKVGRFWLMGTSQTDSEVRFVGAAHLKIEYLDYEINREQGQRRAAVS
ncbi:MAG: outer membrane lipoprotein-sorting protein, partial [Acidobacteria bacterium]|nr:outer membrane lipoprotein-sorting protein [Acidobacteriota bacterium]